MIEVLKDAFDGLQRCPKKIQERIGWQPFEYVRKLRALRADIQAGIDSLDRGEVRELDMHDALRRPAPGVQAAKKTIPVDGSADHRRMG